MTDKDLALMDAQSETICAVDMETNDFILQKILTSLRETCKIKEGSGIEQADITPEELNRILEESSITMAIGKERAQNLFFSLFCIGILDGFLVCRRCGERYPIVNSIPDFVGSSQE